MKLRKGSWRRMLSEYILDAARPDDQFGRGFWILDTGYWILLILILATLSPDT